MQKGTECLPLTPLPSKKLRVSHPALSNIAIVPTINNNNKQTFKCDHAKLHYLQKRSQIYSPHLIYFGHLK
jgi:hypothetical protein